MCRCVEERIDEFRGCLKDSWVAVLLWVIEDYDPVDGIDVGPLEPIRLGRARRVTACLA